MEDHDLRPSASSTSKGRKIVVVEEEDTTREVKRLRSTLSTAMKQIEVSIALAVSIFGVGDYGLFYNLVAL